VHAKHAAVVAGLECEALPVKNWQSCLVWVVVCWVFIWHLSHHAAWMRVVGVSMWVLANSLQLHDGLCVVAACFGCCFRCIAATLVAWHSPAQVSVWDAWWF
jgi:hypothetical protein